MENKGRGCRIIYDNVQTSVVNKKTYTRADTSNNIIYINQEKLDAKNRALCDPC